MLNHVYFPRFHATTDFPSHSLTPGLKSQYQDQVGIYQKYAKTLIKAGHGGAQEAVWKTVLGLRLAWITH